MEATDAESFQIQTPHTLTSLHVEIVSRILMLVESSDIPAVLLTCKSLYSLIMTRQFWYHRIHRLCKEHLVSPPEEELEEYTISELVQWAFRRIRPRCTGFSTELRLRHYDTERAFASKHTELLPGGRWLLMAHRDMSVWFLDLDKDTLEQQPLFDPKCVDSNMRDCSVLANQVWIDHKAPRLSFRYAVCVLDCRDNMAGILLFSRVQIYQVDLIGHGASATLVAHVMATFRTPERSSVLVYAFNDHYFVQGRRFRDGVAMDIYDYSRVPGCLDFPLIESHAFPLAELPKNMQFIHEDILVVRSYSSLLLHIFSVKSSTSAIRLRTIKKSRYLACSNARWTPEASLFTWINTQSFRVNGDRVIRIFGLVIPHNDRDNPWFVELGEFRYRDHSSLRLGIFISLTCDPVDNISRIRHEWDLRSQGSGNLTHISYLEHDVDEPQSIVTFDEDTGRSIHRGRDNTVIVDLVVKRMETAG